MEPEEALAELTALSSQVVEAAIVGESGLVLAATAGHACGESLAILATELLAAARDVRSGAVAVQRVEVVLPEGGVFLVREGGLTIVGRTVPDPTAGLVVYDLRTALRRLEDSPQEQSTDA